MTCAMRILALIFCLAISLSAARAEKLTTANREVLLKNLEKLSDAVNSRVDARFRVAMSAYREAMTSDKAALDLYLKCIEKLNFIDQQKKTSDFLDWKRQELSLIHI